MARKEELEFKPHTGPAGGWGSVGSLLRSFRREHNFVSGSATLLKQNKSDGFTCVSCAWAKPADPHVFEFCENGAKATTWEITPKRVTPDFFAQHTVAELSTWDDHDLEEAGRLTEPMKWDAATDKYLPISWEAAFREIGAEIRALAPDEIVFYSSGRASLEASYLYALYARMLGTNNLPDSSNMCHESTSVALPKSIGVPVGTVTLDDFAKTDLIIFFGQNVATSSPRMLHDLQDASRRGVPIITFNPLRERGLERFTNPQAPVEMLTGSSTRITSQYLQVMPGGDLAAISGICKAVIAADALDHAFIAEHTHGFEAFANRMRELSWELIESKSGLSRQSLEAVASAYAASQRCLGIYGMGVTQHRNGVENVQMIVNLLLLRGNIGKPGAGICPVRGHSNVQGQRTVGITEKPELVPNDKLRELYGFEPPQKKGLNTIEACEGILNGTVRAFVSLGGNFVRAVPDHGRIEPAWRRQRLTVQILTKLNRLCLIHGEVSYILPCLGRIEIDRQAGGPQALSTEDSTACIHGTRGQVEPASPHLLSEVRIVAELAKASLADSRVDWDRWVGDYRLIRDAIERTYPKRFHDFNERMFQPGGFHRPLAARERKWNTETGKANFIVPENLSADPDVEQNDPQVLRLFTLRSNGQFNTTIYSHDDRFRGIYGTRRVILMHRDDMQRLGFAEGDIVTVTCAAARDGEAARQVQDLRVTPYNVPKGACAGYYPECNPLVPLWHHAKGSKVPAVKSIPVRLSKEAPGAAAPWQA
ncbi:MAG TPA: FdhF/YdeP family oxidoreductase [Reyranella sp.]|nr:FdhF/YdeP family oxidoreductase [Reyranella sp.]